MNSIYLVNGSTYGFYKVEDHGYKPGLNLTAKESSERKFAHVHKNVCQVSNATNARKLWLQLCAETDALQVYTSILHTNRVY